MNRVSIREAINIGNIEWRHHALERMLQRGISRNEVKLTVRDGEIIEKYDEDMPFPSALFFHFSTKTIHVVASFDNEIQKIYIITAYIPDIKHFDKDLKIRIKNENK